MLDGQIAQFVDSVLKSTADRLTLKMFCRQQRISTSAAWCCATGDFIDGRRDHHGIVNLQNESHQRTGLPEPRVYRRRRSSSESAISSNARWRGRQEKRLKYGGLDEGKDRIVKYV
ncbi:MAG: hypothetical protein ACLVJ6_14520 [Merdibacter sp.]